MKFITTAFILIFIESTLLINIGIETNDGENNSSAITPENIEPEKLLNLSRIVRSPLPLYLDIVVVVTQESIDLLRWYSMDVHQYFSDVFSVVAKVFSWHNIQFSVSQMEYWDGPLNKNITDQSIDGFLEYFTKKNYSFDSHVVFGHINIDFVGLGYVGTLCTPDAVALIKTSAYLHDVNMAAYVVAHEIGHNMGFEHTENSPWCRCAANETKHCVMNFYNEQWNGNVPKTIEDCLMNQLLRDLDWYPCLKKPLNKERLFATCGDGVVDEGEDCDCGIDELCRNITGENQCCNMTTCKFLKKSYQCSRGECCDKCQFTNKKICRQSNGECDGPEYCDGSSSECPANTIEEDYKYCNKDKGFCYNGRCSDLNKHCQYVYNDPEAYFSTECVAETKNIMRSCRDPTTELYKLLCNNPNICQHFICGRPDSILRDTTGFVLGDTVCFVPLEKIRTGVLSFAANLMKCSDNGNDYCFDGQCINGTKLVEKNKKSKCKPVNDGKYPGVKYTKYFYPNKVAKKLFGYAQNMKLSADYLSSNDQNELLTHSNTWFVACSGIGILSIIVIGLFISKRKLYKDKILNV